MQISRAKNIVLQEASEWPKYMAEENDRGSLMKYGISMIIMTNLVQALGLIIVSAGFAFFGGWGTYYFALHAVRIVLEIGALFVIPKIISGFAPSFGGQASELNGLKVYVYSMTAAWVGMLFTFIPIVGWLVALAGGIYAIIIFWKRTAEAMSVPADKKVVYILLVALAIIVLYWIIGMIAAMLVAGLAVGTFLGTGGFHHGIM